MRPAWSGLKAGAQTRKAGRTPTVVMGRKYCCRCGRWRHLADFRPHLERSPYPVPYCDNCRRAMVRERQRVANLSPEALKRRREQNRMYAEAKRRLNGMSQRRFKTRPTVVDKPELVFLDPSPLVGYLRRNYDDTERALANAAGISERALYRYRTGESALVRLDIADRLALAMGTSLWQLYGDAPLISCHG